MVVAPLRVTLLLLIVDQGNKNFILHDVFGLPLSKLRLSLFLWNFLLLLCCLSPIISFRLRQTLIQSNQVCIAVFSPPNTTKKDLLTTHMTRKQRKSKTIIIIANQIQSPKSKKKKKNFLPENLLMTDHFKTQE